jgi:translocation and assembly module TamB
VTLNGTLQEPRPQGTIDLLKGQVNVYTTLFILDRPYPQTATFVPDQGLDPNLNVHMVTSVPEVSRVPLPQSPLESSEIAIPASTSFGAIRTVRIQAIAQGPASKILDNLELKSSPARSPDEILALLGGGFVGALEQGNSTLAIANLAGSAFFTNLQSRINNNIGLIDVRIFPAVIPKDNSRNPSTIDLAGEIGVPITRNFSASVLSLLTSRDPLTLFNLRYRVNDEVQLRGATDFVGENRVVVEFDKRF